MLAADLLCQYSAANLSSRADGWAARAVDRQQLRTSNSSDKMHFTLTYLKSDRLEHSWPDPVNAQTMRRASVQALPGCCRVCVCLCERCTHTGSQMVQTRSGEWSESSAHSQTVIRGVSRRVPIRLVCSELTWWRKWTYFVVLSSDASCEFF